METEKVTAKRAADVDLPAPLQRVRADVEGLHHVSGTMLIRVQGAPVGSLAVQEGRAEFRPGVEEGQVIAEFGEAEDIRSMLRGELNPVVAGLQRRLLLLGDVCLGAKIVLGLRTGAAFEPVLE